MLPHNILDEGKDQRERMLGDRIVIGPGRRRYGDAVLRGRRHVDSVVPHAHSRNHFQAWVGVLARQVGEAIRTAAGARRPCTLQAVTVMADGLGVYRRILTTEGIVLSHPPPPPEAVISREGPVDPAVSVAAFRESAGHPPVALLVNATCHPVHEMCLPQISPDYPGEMSELLERRHPGATALFLNGAAGNINPPVVSGGPAYAARHGRALADKVDESLSCLHPVGGATLALRRRDVRLPLRTRRGKPSSRTLKTRITALRLGEALFVFLPGEPFVETGLAIKERSPFDFTAVVGYAESSIGYVPTERAFDEGGYEIGPGRWSYLGRGCEEILRREAISLADESARIPLP